MYHLMPGKKNQCYYFLVAEQLYTHPCVSVCLMSVPPFVFPPYGEIYSDLYCVSGCDELLEEKDELRRWSTFQSVTKLKNYTTCTQV